KKNNRRTRRISQKKSVAYGCPFCVVLCVLRLQKVFQLFPLPLVPFRFTPMRENVVPEFTQVVAGQHANFYGAEVGLTCRHEGLCEIL
ncbi:MAG: hypothetical protein U9P12_06335, partial [Verrucomicrobiota bacterium]|nr:hypothetical protein [Verrucomicrobiota bacterium]